MKSRRTRTRTRRHNGKILTSRSSSPQETRGPPRVPSVPRAAGIGVLGPRTAKAKAGGTTRVTGPGNGVGLAPLSTKCATEAEGPELGLGLHPSTSTTVNLPQKNYTKRSRALQFSGPDLDLDLGSAKHDARKSGFVSVCTKVC